MHLPEFSIYDDVAQPKFVLIKNAASQIVYAFLNSCGCKMLGHPLDAVIGKPANILLDGRSRHSVLDLRAQAWDDGPPVTDDNILFFGNRRFLGAHWVWRAG